MDTRKLSVVSGVLIFIAALFLSWYIVSEDDDENEQASANEVASVLMMEYAPSPIRSSIQFTGRVIPYDQFDIYAEVSGIFERGDHTFKTGTTFSRGDAILNINDAEERQQVLSARYEFSAAISQILADINIDYSDYFDEWQTYFDDFDASTPLEPLPEVTDRQFRMFLNRQNIFSRFSSIRQQEVRLDKFTIRAPYDGVLTDHTINPGALVQNGQRLGRFTGTNQLEIEASIPAREARFISAGDQVSVRTTGMNPETYTASISRKNAIIEPGTQSIKIFIEIEGNDLEPGNYLEGDISGQLFPEAFKVHKDILVRDNELFIVENDRARLHTVQLLASAGDSMIIAGLEPGTKLIDEFRNAAFEDAEVTEREDR